MHYVEGWLYLISSAEIRNFVFSLSKSDFEGVLLCFVIDFFDIHSGGYYSQSNRACILAQESLLEID